MDPGHEIAVLAELARKERSAIVATIARRSGSIDVDEEAVDRAIEAALEQWPRDGVPESPRAWLYRAAMHNATDALRHRSMAERARLDLAESTTEPIDSACAAFPDDQLRLIFTCCHPAIAEDAQVALALRLLCGLRTEEVARAFTVPEATMAQRLVRAKAKIQAARIPYEVPEASELGERVDAVLAVIYAIGSEGYVATGGPSLLRVDLAREAIRLAELVVELLPARDESKALLALLLLIDARRDARVAPSGTLVLLENQDRSRWNRTQITRAQALLGEVLTRDASGPKVVHTYAIEAAIQAVHDEATSYDTTDFKQIAILYRLLRERADSPLVELNEAVAIAMAEGPLSGLARVHAMIARGTLHDHHLLWATEADLLRRLGRTREALAAYDRARGLAMNDVERAFLDERSRRLRD
ncbi:sigma-70 family RNA polymerase sigma factor [soil metagenome]